LEATAICLDDDGDDEDDEDDDDDEWTFVSRSSVTATGDVNSALRLLLARQTRHWMSSAKQSSLSSHMTERIQKQDSHKT
jgi:hypothetical protein